jgi:hypothetical protein
MTITGNAISLPAISSASVNRILVSNGGAIAYRDGIDTRVWGSSLLDTSNISGTANIIAKFTSANVIGNSLLQDTGAALTYNGATVWTSANDGPGSGLDADYLGGVANATFIRYSSAGTTSYIAKFSGTNTVIPSGIYESGGNVNVGGTSVVEKLNVSGNILFYNTIRSEIDGYLLCNVNANYIYIGDNATFNNQVAIGGNTVRVMTITGNAISLPAISSASVNRILVSNGGAIAYRDGIDTRVWGSSLLDTSNVSGTSGYIAKFTGTNTVASSVIYESSSNIGIGTASLGYKLVVSGTATSVNSVITINNNTFIQDTANYGMLACNIYGDSGSWHLSDVAKYASVIQLPNNGGNIVLAGTYVAGSTTLRQMLVLDAVNNRAWFPSGISLGIGTSTPGGAITNTVKSTGQDARYTMLYNVGNTVTDAGTFTRSTRSPGAKIVCDSGKLSNGGILPVIFTNNAASAYTSITGGGHIIIRSLHEPTLWDRDESCSYIFHFLAPDCGHSVITGGSGSSTGTTIVLGFVKDTLWKFNIYIEEGTVSGSAKLCFQNNLGSDYEIFYWIFYSAL